MCAWSRLGRASSRLDKLNSDPSFHLGTCAVSKPPDGASRIGGNMTERSHSTSQSSAERRATLFRRFSHEVANMMGSYWAFLLACLAVLAWGILGPPFHFAERWELAMNTAATV